jgi:hypothetical protein
MSKTRQHWNAQCHMVWRTQWCVQGQLEGTRARQVIEWKWKATAAEYTCKKKKRERKPHVSSNLVFFLFLTSSCINAALRVWTLNAQEDEWVARPKTDGNYMSEFCQRRETPEDHCWWNDGLARLIGVIIGPWLASCLEEQAAARKDCQESTPGWIGTWTGFIPNCPSSDPLNKRSKYRCTDVKKKNYAHDVLSEIVK